MGIVAAMGFELSYDMFGAEGLRESERRMDLATSAGRPWALGVRTSRALKSGLRTSPAPGQLEVQCCARSWAARSLSGIRNSRVTPFSSTTL
jgi:hypothetical protein